MSQGGGQGDGPSSPDERLQYASDEYAIGADTDSYDDNDPSALTDFRAPLESYGTWADDPTYGTVWAPSPDLVGADFTPYVSAGHWAYDNDYVWVSDYPWGWAPFHYGRWVVADGRGWVWIPGREYRGAWVTWSVDDGYSYLGWAPIGPAFVWFGGVPLGWRGTWGPRWSYLPRGAVFAPRVSARVVVGPSAIAIASRMRPYAAVTATEGHLGGPPPQRFGYRPEQVPRISGPAALGIAHAQQFAKPSTAQPLGASAPTAARIEPRTSSGDNGARAPVGIGGRSWAPSDARGPLVPSREPSLSNGPRSVVPGEPSAPHVSPNAGVPERAPAPEFHPSGTAGAFHAGGGGGGHHR